MEMNGDLYLYSTSKKFYLQRINNEQTVLTINRVNGEKLIEKYPNKKELLNARKERICGVLGEIKLIAGPYLVIVTKKKRVGPIASHSVWQIEEIEVIPFCTSFNHLTAAQDKMNEVYVRMLEGILNTPYFYFSYTYDLTHTMQRMHSYSRSNVKSTSMYEHSDKRFLWNHHLLKEFCTKPGFSRFCIPIIHGFISINPFTFGTADSLITKTFVWSLISRRSCKRAGTRLFTRGIDSDGNVANYVETEQVVEYEGSRSSYVQTRGSIPFFWNQYPDMHLKPKMQIEPSENHVEACKRHLKEQVQHYKEVVLVNLIDQRGEEDAIGRKYKALIEEIGHKKVRYEAYDFHHECKNMQWDKLQVLIDRLSYEQDNFKYFFVQSNGSLISLQSGVFRTNCIDCLDRTNVVQSMLAWRNLLQVFTQMDLVQDNSVSTSFQDMFKNVWADNADCLSVQYSGACALKTDYTRTGKRTYSGMLADGWNTLVRYYKNNLMGGYRQDSLDLFLGNYVVSKHECTSVPCPLDKPPSKKLAAVRLKFVDRILRRLEKKINL